MKQQKYIDNLKESLDFLNDSLQWLERSFTKCSAIGIKKDLTKDEYDEFENLASRFARTSDILIQKVLKSIDLVEFEPEGTLIDVINRADKRGFFESVDDIREIRDLRNDIVHEYLTEELENVFKNIFKYTPKLFTIINNIKEYCAKYSEIRGI